jgi:hypothetical protein
MMGELVVTQAKVMEGQEAIVVAQVHLLSGVILVAMALIVVKMEVSVSPQE